MKWMTLQALRTVRARRAWEPPDHRNARYPQSVSWLTAPPVHRKFRERSRRLKSCRMRCTRRHRGQRYRKSTQPVTDGNSMRRSETYSHSNVLKFSHGTMKVKRRFVCLLAVAVALCATAGSEPVRGQAPRLVASHPASSITVP